MTDSGITEHERRSLRRVVQLVTPHPGVPDAVFDRTTDHVIAVALSDQGLGALLRRHLIDWSSRGVAEMPNADGIEFVRTLEGSPVFRFLRAEAVGYFYSDMDVYAVIGYEGPSFDLGGYVERGFDDLDWLPDPYAREALP